MKKFIVGQVLKQLVLSSDWSSVFPLVGDYGPIKVVNISAKLYNWDPVLTKVLLYH